MLKPISISNHLDSNQRQTYFGNRITGALGSMTDTRLKGVSTGINQR
jgi:hypothetical protein